MIPSESTLTPIMQQYWSIKKHHMKPLVFFQLGDFYELFYDDAVRASQMLDLTLTHRGHGSAEKIPMAGIPVHTLENYLKKCLSLSECVVVCDQIGIPDGKGIMERAVQRIYTPGTVYESEFVDPSQSNYLVCFAAAPQGLCLVWADLCEGVIQWNEGTISEMHEELTRLAPREIIGCDKDLLEEQAHFTSIDPWYFNIEENEPYISKALPNFGTYRDLSMSPEILGTIGAFIRYSTMHTGSDQLFTQIKQTRSHELLGVDRQTRQHLEIDSAEPSQGLLYGVLNHTRTQGGARLLKKWIAYPTRNRDTLNHRYDTLGHWNNHSALLHSSRITLKELCDLERIATKIATMKIRPREIIMLKETLAHSANLRTQLAGSPLALSPESAIETAFCDLIGQWILEEPANTLKEGAVIQPTVCEEYGRLAHLLTHQQELLEQYALQEQKQHGLTIRAGSNHIQGFFLELSKGDSERIPKHFMRIQTLKHCERYQTSELREIQHNVIAARLAVAGKQEALWQTFIGLLGQHIESLKTLASEIFWIDVTQSLAYASQNSATTRPVYSDRDEICIEQGRHPTLEHKKGLKFMANDCLLERDNPFMLLTGPNMGGKSTYMRQVALIIFMAHIGAYVPAKRVVLGPIDQILTRIGAQDALAMDQSTFMVELTETARILRQATPNSFILIDEMGRGTSTYDGLALAAATMEELFDHNQSFCLFSTHYHELKTFSQERPGIQHSCFRGVIQNNIIHFPYKLEPGSIEHSFGLYVAQKAGLPSRLTERAWKIHAELAHNAPQTLNNEEPVAIPMITEDLLSPLYWDLETMSPKLAWTNLWAWQETTLQARNYKKTTEYSDLQ